MDFATRDVAEAARGADLVMLAVPIVTMPSLLRRDGAASAGRRGHNRRWKRQGLGGARNLSRCSGRRWRWWRRIRWRARKPPARRGRPELFVDRRVIVTPSARTTPSALAKVEELWRVTGARVERMEPEVHDQILARSSHLPQLSRAPWPRRWPKSASAGRLAAEFGAGGLRDTTRLAMSSAEMWRDICLTNREAILRRWRFIVARWMSLSVWLRPATAPGWKRPCAGSADARARI